ncbi:MAG: hypothetical protein LBJ09_02050 [Clostridiales bacterium]|jgi:hypothetical protein|nr:hypothetical protein [Clostridiales bacterium]
MNGIFFQCYRILDMDEQTVENAEAAHLRLFSGDRQGIGPDGNVVAFANFENDIDIVEARNCYGILQSFSMLVDFASRPIIEELERQLEEEKIRYESKKPFSDSLKEEIAASDKLILSNILYGKKFLVNRVKELVTEAEFKVRSIELFSFLQEARRVEQQRILSEEEDRRNRRARFIFDEEVFERTQIRELEDHAEKNLRQYKEINDDINNIKRDLQK